MKTNRYPRQSKKSAARKLWIMVFLVVILVAGSLFVGYRLLRKSPSSVTPEKTADFVDLSPATEEEKQDAHEQKEKTIEREEQQPTNTGTQATVTPVIVDAGQYDKIEVRSFVPNIVENGGKCTVVFSKGTRSVTRTADATQDATTTRCTNIAVERNAFAEAGTWSVVVSYESATAKGSSQAKTFEVR